MKIVSLLICTLTALAASQFPAFERMYEMRLQAHLQESSQQLSLYERAAQATHHSLDSYIEFFANQPAAEFQENGKLMRVTLNRKEYLATYSSKLSTTPYPQKVFTWLYHFDRPLFYDTWNSYQPMLVMDRISSYFAACGAIMGYFLSALIMRLLSKVIGSIGSSIRSCWPFKKKSA